MQRGFAPIFLIVGILIVGVAGGAYYFGYDHGFEKSTKSLTSQIPASTTQSESTSSAETANWKTYTNNEYGFSFKYPGDWWEGKATENYRFFFGPPASVNHIGEKIPPTATAELSIILVDISKNNHDLDKNIENHNSCISNQSNLKEVTDIGKNKVVIFRKESLCGIGNGRDIAYVLNNGYLYEITKNYWGNPDIEIDQILSTFKFLP